MKCSEALPIDGNDLLNTKSYASLPIAVSEVQNWGDYL